MFISDAGGGINNYPVGILFTGSEPLSNLIAAPVPSVPSALNKSWANQMPKKNHLTGAPV